MGRRGHLARVGEPLQPRPKVRLDGAEELGERKRAEEQVGDPPDGHRQPGLVERELEQRARRDDRKGRPVLPQVSQRLDRLRNRLDLIQKQQRPRTVDGPSGQNRELLADPIRVQRGEHPLQPAVPLQVDFAQG